MTSSNEIQLKPDERVDELNRKGYRIIQDTKQFCFGMDAVLLSAFVKVKPKQRVLDLGTGMFYQVIFNFFHICPA